MAVSMDPGVSKALVSVLVQPFLSLTSQQQQVFDEALEEQ